MQNIFERILKSKHKEVELLIQRTTRGDMKSKAKDYVRGIRDFRGALDSRGGELTVIAEIKRKSPSKGLLYEGDVKKLLYQDLFYSCSFRYFNYFGSCALFQKGIKLGIRYIRL